MLALGARRVILLSSRRMCVPSMFRRFNVTEVLYSEGSVFRRFYIPKVLCYKGYMFRRFYVPKGHSVCSENTLTTTLFEPKSSDIKLSKLVGLKDVYFSQIVLTPL